MPESEPIKAGVKTSEFWITAVVAVAGAISGLQLPTESLAARIVAAILTLGAVLGYQYARGSVKRRKLELDRLDVETIRVLLQEGDKK